MIIKSIHGTFSIHSSGKDQDRLLVKSDDKKSLMRIFDEKRVVQNQSENNMYFVSLCKQEFAHTLILMVKEVNYSDFEKMMQEATKDSDEVFA